MNTTEIKIEIDFTDLDQLRSLMDDYGDSEQMFFGESTHGETQCISINPDNIVLETFQDNGYTRTNIYHYNGDVEEYYEK